ncbi:hypothetical protein [Mesorhizobium onobrychidis]
MRQYKRGKIPGYLHVSVGQEAAIVGGGYVSPFGTMTP